MRAVAKPAAAGEGSQVAEGGIDARGGIPRLDLAHAGRVDHDKAARGDEQLALRGGVPALAVGGAHLLRVLQVFADQPVDQGGLADARRAEQGDGGAGREVRREGLQAAARLGADDKHRHVGCDGGDPGFQVRRVILGEVRLVQQDDRLGAARPRGGQVALEAVQVVVAVERADKEHGVNVGRDDLLDFLKAGGLAGKLRPARQDGVDVDAGFLAHLRGHRHPVADGGEVGLGRSRVDELARARAELGAKLARDLVVALELKGDPPGHAALRREGREGRREVVVPAEFSQRHRRGAWTLRPLCARTEPCARSRRRIRCRWRPPAPGAGRRARAGLGRR